MFEGRLGWGRERRDREGDGYESRVMSATDSTSPSNTEA